MKLTNRRDHEQAKSPISLEQFIQELGKFAHPIGLYELKQLLSELEIRDDEIQNLRRFECETYQRNLVAENEHFEALLLCFEAGQRTPIHDHAGCACGVKVIEGVATETIFKKSDGGWLYATGSTDLSAPGVVGSFDMDIHQLSNLQADGKHLITLHVYSPPLGEVGNYSITDNSVNHVTAQTRNQ